MTVYEFGNPDASNVLIQPVDDHDWQGLEEQMQIITNSVGGDFRLLGVKVAAWSRDLSPWPAPPAFGKEAFGGQAEATLAKLLPLCADRSKRYFIGGYSLAGLFALWASSRTDAFSGVAAASASVWFPGFTDYLRENPPHAGRVYLSLGDKEAQTKNPVMATVDARMRETEALLRAQGIDCVLAWNPGDHFRDTALRTAQAFAWLLAPDVPSG